MGFIQNIKNVVNQGEINKIKNSCYGCKYLTEDPDGRVLCQFDAEKNCSALTRKRKVLKADLEKKYGDIL